MIESCKVVNVDPIKNTIRVSRIERFDVISAEIKVFKHMDLPALDSYVICIFDGSTGYLLGELE